MGGKYCSSSRVAIRKLSTSSRRIVTLARTYICVRILIFIFIFEYHIIRITNIILILNKNDTFGLVRGIEILNTTCDTSITNYLVYNTYIINAVIR